MASPPFNIAETVPADNDFVRLFPAAERLFRDIVESWLSLEHDSTTGRHKLPTDTTANLAGLSYPTTGALRFDTTLDVLQFKKAAGFTSLNLPTGAIILHRSSTGTAPPGWTKTTGFGGKWMITVQDGGFTDGGTDVVDDVFISRLILQANLPNVNFTVTGTASLEGNHSHGGAVSLDGNHSHTPSIGGSFEVETGAGGSGTAGGTGRNLTGSTNVAGLHTHLISLDGAHTHTVTGTAASGGAGTGLNFNVKRRDFNEVTKNATG